MTQRLHQRLAEMHKEKRLVKGSAGSSPRMPQDGTKHINYEDENKQHTIRNIKKKKKKLQRLNVCVTFGRMWEMHEYIHVQHPSAELPT